MGRVGHVMTESVLSIDVEESAGEVLRLFASYPIHHLPVLSDQVVVGMLSSADIMKLHAFLPRNSVPPDSYLDQHVRLANLMSKPVITIEAAEPVSEAARLMAIHGIHALPVVDSHKRLLGIITTTDIMQAALQRGPSPGASVAADTPVAPLDVGLTAAAFDQAITAAKAAVEGGEDEDNIAMGLLVLQRRMAALERVLQVADRYFNCGQEHSQQAELLKAIGEAKRTGARRAGDVSRPLGLIAV